MKQTWTKEEIDSAFFKLLEDTYDWWTYQSGIYIQGMYDLRRVLLAMEDSKNED